MGEGGWERRADMSFSGPNIVVGVAILAVAGGSLLYVVVFMIRLVCDCYG